MRIALSIYALVYATVTAFTIIEDFRSKKSLFDKLCDSVLLPLGLAGILLLAYSVHGIGLKMVWQFIAPMIVIGQIVNNLLGRRRAMSQGNTRRDEKMFGDVGTTVLLVPMFVVNLIYAFA